MLLAQREVHTEVNSVSERRRGFRIRQARPIKLFVAACGEIIAGQTQNISATGLRIELPVGSDVMANDAVFIHMSSIGPAGAPRLGMIPARIAWLEHGRNKLVAGVEFTTSQSAHRAA